MPKQVFISYSHQQRPWVQNVLVPCLEAGGAEVLIDYRAYQGGQRVVGQMNALQDSADIQLLLFSPDYLASAYCRHEMKRARQKDPDFSGIVQTVLRENCLLPKWLEAFNAPLWIDLRDERNAAQWKILLDACGASLGCHAPDWLKAREDIARYLDREISVNLVIQGKGIQWEALLGPGSTQLLPPLGWVDLQSGATTTGAALVEEILRAIGSPARVPRNSGEELVILDRVIRQRPQKAWLALCHFERVVGRQYHHTDLFSALRFLITETRKLVLLVQSRRPFAELLPPAEGHPLSEIPMRMVELRHTP